MTPATVAITPVTARLPSRSVASSQAVSMVKSGYEARIGETTTTWPCSKAVKRQKVPVAVSAPVRRTSHPHRAPPG